MKKTFFMTIISVLISMSLYAEPELVIQEGNAGTVKYLKYSNDGKYIMSANLRGEAKIYERESGILVKSFILSGFFRDFSPDANWIVSDSDKGILLTNVMNREEFIIGHRYKSGHAVRASFSPDGRRVALPMETYIDIYNIQTKQKTSVLRNSGLFFYDPIKWSKDGNYLSILAGKEKMKISKTNIIYDLRTNVVISSLQGARFDDSAFSRDGKYIACREYADEISVRPINKSERLRTFESHSYDGKMCGLCFSDDSLYVLQQNKMRVWRISDWEQTIDSELRYSAYCIDVTPDSEKCILGGAQQIYEMARKGTAYGTTYVQSKVVSGASQLMRMHYSEETDNALVSNVILEEGLSLCGNSFQEIRAQQLPQGRTSVFAFFDDGVLYLTLDTNEIRKFTFSDGKSIKLMNYTGKMGEHRIVSNKKGSRFALCSQKNGVTKVCVYDVKNDRTFEKYTFIPENVCDFKGFYLSCFNKDGSLFLLKGVARGWELYNLETKAKRFIKTSGTGNFACFSHDSKRIALEDDNSIKIYNAESLKLEYEIGVSSVASAFRPFFSPDGKNLACLYYPSASSLTISIFDTATWSLIKSIDYGADDIIPNENYFNKDSSRIIILDSSGAIRCYSTQTGKLLSSTIVNSSGDWLTYTPEGYFNGSEGGVKKFVHLVNGMEVSELGQYAETFYRPDLVAAKLRGEDVAKKEETLSLSQVVATGQAPVAQFVNTPDASDSRDVTVNFMVKDQGGGIGSVYLKLNDKVIQLADGSRKLALEASGSAQKSAGAAARFSHTVTLQNGENTLEAYATNAAGKIESLHAVAKIAWKGAASKPSLHVLSVGVNKYRDRSLWLQYSVPDAQAVLQSFGSKKTSLYKDIFTYELLDGDVTKENLLSKFNSISPKVAADDVFILFVAGHGTTSQKTGDYYFIPSNFRYTDSEAILSQGISKSDILACMSGIKASKTLIMLDTCNSGAFTNDASARGFAEKTAVERLVRATGQAVLAASSEEQSAMEGYKGHGVFTYVLLEALSGKADKNKDGYVTLNELAFYIEEQVPELSYQKWGYEQVPMKELRKQDFPLVGK